jgi:hypothetical protein
MKEQEREEMKAKSSRKRENLPHCTTPFIGVLKCIYCRTLMVQSASSRRPIHRRLNSKKVKGEWAQIKMWPM